MAEESPTIDERLDALERRLPEVETLLSDVIDGLNEPPKRTLRHRFVSIRQLQEQVGEVDESFHRLIDELHTPPK